MGRKITPEQGRLYTEIVLGAILLLTAVLTWLTYGSRLEPPVVLAVVVSAVVVQLVGSLGYTWINSLTKSRKYEDMLESHLGGELPLMSEEGVKRLERGCDETVWIVAKDLEFDTRSLKDLIIWNMRKGVQYKYLLAQPSGADMHYVDSFRKKLRDAGVQAHAEFRCIEHLPFPTETVIYDDEDLAQNAGYIALPVPNSVKFKYLELRDSAELRRTKRLMIEAWEEASPLPEGNMKTQQIS